ncbi:aerotaxis receptor [mine drainage metagenome]|uniref:Aerotaxis receptor n=1 Tax=mine drainage metagenome TaxID=410659 RepID=A0A1J5PDJ8_9ZZZZ
MLSMGFNPSIDVRQVTNKAIELGSHRALQSKTDLQGIITHASRSLADISGFTVDELIGQPHNILRHPDMPDAVYYLMWQKIRMGEEFYGIVKNRCKNGDHYWVMTRVAPVIENGVPVGYTSARFTPRTELVPMWEELFAKMRGAENDSGFNDERRFKPAHDILCKLVQRKGYKDLSQLVLSQRV